MPELVVDGKRIAQEDPAYVIAEIGHNHQGDLEKAKALIHAAKECGVDAVKFQKRDNRRLFTRAFYDSPYDNENSFGATYGEHREALELGQERLVRAQPLRARGRRRLRRGRVRRAERGPPGRARTSTPSSSPRATCSNVPFLRYVAAFGKPMFLSTGGGTIEDIDRAVEAIVPLNAPALRAPLHRLVPGRGRGSQSLGDHDAAGALSRSS